MMRWQKWLAAGLQVWILTLILMAQVWAFGVDHASWDALRPQAYTTAQLDVQLEDQARRFLGDRSRNRFAEGRLIISPIFKWRWKNFKHDDQILGQRP